jgi:carbamoyl-phosphate synthase large subunit
MARKQQPVKNKPSGRTLKVLFTCIGRRVSLLKAFQRAARQLCLDVDFMGADCQYASPALQLCHRRFLVHPTTHRSYLSDIREIVRVQGVDLLVPTVDLDLKALARQRKSLASLGCQVLVSSPRVVEICQDKRQTHDFLTKAGIDTPQTVSLDDQFENQPLPYPCYVKPWDGFASRFNTIAQTKQDLVHLGRKVPHAICQALVIGHEFTCDVYVDMSHRVRCVVPRQRLEVRSGEVSKARVVMNPDLINVAAQVVQRLKAGPGVITVQLIKTPTSEIKVIEINPRFGGGVPLSIRARADFPKWILQEITGQVPSIDEVTIQEDLVMLRYDQEVWSTAKALGLEEQTP